MTKKKLEILIPYHDALIGTTLLVKSLNRYSLNNYDINLLGYKKIDFDLKELKKISDKEIKYISTNDLSAENRIYKYLSYTKYSFSIVMHTDTEIIDFDPISELVAIVNKFERIGLIGKPRLGRYVSAGGFLPPTMSSHFLLVNNLLMKEFYKKTLKEDFINKNDGFTYRNEDIFPTRAFHLAVSSRIQCMAMPYSIQSKLMHYNSSTRRKNQKLSNLNNYDSIRTTQLDIDSGLISIRNKISHQYIKSTNIVIVGIGDDGKSTLNYLKKNKIYKNIFFYDPHVSLHGDKFKGYKILSFKDVCNIDPLPYFYICIPNYKWFVNFLQFSGLAYGLDYNVRLRHGHSLFDFEHLTYNPSLQNDLYVENDKIFEPNNMFIDSPNSNSLSFYHAANYIIVVFFHTIRSTLRKIFRGN